MMSAFDSLSLTAPAINGDYYHYCPICEGECQAGGDGLHPGADNHAPSEMRMRREYLEGRSRGQLLPSGPQLRPASIKAKEFAPILRLVYSRGLLELGVGPWMYGARVRTSSAAYRRGSPVVDLGVGTVERPTFLDMMRYVARQGPSNYHSGCLWRQSCGSPARTVWVRWDRLARRGVPPGLGHKIGCGFN